MRVTERSVHENLFRDHSLVHAQSLSDFRNVLRDELVNPKDYTLDDLWDEPAPQEFLWEISIVSVSIYLWIPPWIAFWVAYGVNQFFGIAYGVNMFI